VSALRGGLALGLVGLGLWAGVWAAAGSATATSAEPTPGRVVGRFVSEARLQTRGETSQRDVVVYLEPRGATAELPWQHTPPTAPLEVRQAQLQFDPHVLPLLVGSKVSFVNGDTVDHNVFSDAACCAMNDDMAPGQSRERTFAEPGVLTLVCRLHPEMSMWVVALRHPWFHAVQVEKIKDGEATRYEAAFRLEGVPPGSYDLTFWNKALTPIRVPVEVTEGAEVNVDLHIGP
jgi:plastocyanin